METISAFAGPPAPETENSGGSSSGQPELSPPPVASRPPVPPLSDFVPNAGTPLGGGAPLGVLGGASIPNTARDSQLASARNDRGDLWRSLSREVALRSSFSTVPRPRARWVHRYATLLIVGEGGLGKTTLARNLLAAYADDPELVVRDAGAGPEAARAFSRDPAAFATEVSVEDRAHRAVYHYAVVDTPGYGESGGPLAAERAAVLGVVARGNERHLRAERDPSRRTSLAALPDQRIDACLYFLPPHRVRGRDVEFVRELSRVVPVIPVLAKADSMTDEELAEHRANVAEALGKHAWVPSSEALAEAGLAHPPPLPVVGSRTMDPSVGRFWPVRRYPWGDVEAQVSTHSEVAALRRLAFETGLEELKHATEERYHAFRALEAQKELARSRSLIRRAAGSAAKLAATAAVVWLLAGSASLLTDAGRRDRFATAAAGLGRRSAATIGKNARLLTAAAQRVIETEEQRKVREAREAREAAAKKKGWFGRKRT